MNSLLVSEVGIIIEYMREYMRESISIINKIFNVYLFNVNFILIKVRFLYFEFLSWGKYWIGINK